MIAIYILLFLIIALISVILCGVAIGSIELVSRNKCEGCKFCDKITPYEREGFFENGDWVYAYHCKLLNKLSIGPQYDCEYRIGIGEE